MAEPMKPVAPVLASECLHFWLCSVYLAYRGDIHVREGSREQETPHDKNHASPRAYGLLGHFLRDLPRIQAGSFMIIKPTGGKKWQYQAYRRL